MAPLLLLLLLLLGAAAARPNFVFVLTDDLDVLLGSEVRAITRKHDKGKKEDEEEDDDE